ncbi:MAG: hypothetical protein GY799_12270 [Desulfobulbaceae bacterium]|nr:hypothetical protein [Desulfobulbaceae bacterium]
MNIVFWGTGTSYPTPKEALDYAKAQGYLGLAQDLYIELNADTTTALFGAFDDIALHDYENAGARVIFSNPNNYNWVINALNATYIFWGSTSLSEEFVFDGLNIKVLSEGASGTPRLFNLVAIASKVTIKNCTLEDPTQVCAAFDLVNIASVNAVINIYNNNTIGFAKVFATCSTTGSGAPTVSIEDNIFVGCSSFGATYAIVNTTAGSYVDNTFNLYRNYCTSAVTTNAVGEHANLTDGFYVAPASGGSDTCTAQRGVPFDDSTFFETSDPVNLLYLVPRGDFAWSTIPQATGIAENTVSRNGILYDGSNRKVGCMGVPESVDAPSAISIATDGYEATVTWTREGSGGTVSYNTIPDRATATAVGTTASNTLTFEVPIEDRQKTLYPFVEAV